MINTAEYSYDQQKGEIIIDFGNKVFKLIFADRNSILSHIHGDNFNERRETIKYTYDDYCPMNGHKESTGFDNADDYEITPEDFDSYCQSRRKEWEELPE